MTQTIFDVRQTETLTEGWNIRDEAIYILREVHGQFKRPVLLFSGGKDSLALVHLAAKAFAPGRIPFPLLHIDTGHNYPETLEFRDKLVRDLGLELIVRKVEDSIRSGRVQEEEGPNPSRNSLQSVTLLDAIQELGADVAIGGARRDEEKARAKERVFSHRSVQGTWEPENQRPELWHLYNGRKLPGEHFRVFPISNWTEADVWRFIVDEGFEIPTLYFSHFRQVVNRNGILLGVLPFTQLLEGETPEVKRIRFRTIGDATCTGALESNASTLEEILNEVLSSNFTERSARGDDQRSDAAMEDRKRKGYF